MINQIVKLFNILLRSRIFYILLFVSITTIVIESSPGNNNDPDYSDAALLDLEEETLISDENSKIEHSAQPTKADSIIDYAQSLKGVPYKWAGKTTKGFDCSGFIFHVFNKYGIDLPSSSAVIFTVGTPISKDDLVKGDLVFFTGTDTSIRKVGHVGIISSEAGENLQFIHSSSGGGGRGVTINDLDHAHYAARYMGAKRMESM